MREHDNESERLIQQEELILDVTETMVEVLEKVGVTRKVLAERLGCTLGYVSQLLGGRNLTLRTISDVAFVLNVRPSFVMTQEGAKNVPVKAHTVHLPDSRWNLGALWNNEGTLLKTEIPHNDDYEKAA